ncbi:unnamed protein product [Urochloa humidicola]
MEVIDLGKGGAGVSLPEDIIFDVLARLPAKVLCRFRCVCKGWRALISGPAFVAAQKSRAAPVIVGVFGSRCTGRRKFELRVMDMDGSILRVFKDVIKSLTPTRLDDLICVYKTWCGAMIIEPANGRVLAIDETEPGTPLSSWIYYGFGRAVPSGAYKLLRIHVPFDSRYGHYLCDIATINGNCSEVTWRQRPEPPVSIYWYGDSKATVNGILYFMLSDTSSQGRPRVATFNLETEEWTETIDGPAMGPRKDDNGEAWDFALVELKAALNMVRTAYCRPLSNQDGFGVNAHIWLLVDSKKSIWVKQYAIQMPEKLHDVKVLDVLGDGRILFLNKDQFNRYSLQFYDPSIEALTDFMEMPNEFDGDMAFYTGSLLS